jgi:hypothetical protein
MVKARKPLTMYSLSVLLLKFDLENGFESHFPERTTISRAYHGYLPWRQEFCSILESLLDAIKGDWWQY